MAKLQPDQLTMQGCQEVGKLVQVQAVLARRAEESAHDPRATLFIPADQMHVYI